LDASALADGALWYPKWYPGPETERDARRVVGCKWLIMKV
jgi:hypothetical protein